MKAFLLFRWSGWLVLSMLMAHADTALPRYHFTPGQKLVYHGESEFKYSDPKATFSGAFNTTTETDIWVTRQNADGSSHVLTCTKVAMHQTMDNETIQPSPDQVRTIWTSADILPSGEALHVESTGEEGDNVAAIWPLPKDEQALKQGWQRVNVGAFASTDAFTVDSARSSGASMLIHDVQTSPLDSIYLSSRSNDLTFDLAKGLVTHIDENATQGYGFAGKTVGTTDLMNVATVDPETLKQLEHDFAIALPAHKSVTTFIRPGMAPGDMASAGETEKQMLQKVRGQLQRPELQPLIDKDIAEIPDIVAGEKQDTQNKQALLHAPAANWKTTDLAGKPCTLADFRGKVVVLDFWYRGCGWCMLAMPQVKEVAAHFAGQQVAVLAMSTDMPDTKDADFVVQKMGLTYPTLYAKDIAQTYKIRGFPTLLILDRNGLVKDIKVGYSSTLRDDVERKVDSLLAASR